MSCKLRLAFGCWLFGNLGLDSLHQQGTRPIAQNFRERILEGSWLYQLGHVIVWYGISLTSVEK